MKVYIGYSTSLNYWLEHRTDVPCYSSVAHCVSVNDAAVRDSDLESMDLPSLGLSASTSRGWATRAKRSRTAKRRLPDGPAIHVLVPARADRNRTEGFDRHRWTSRIPDGSLRMLRPDVLISSPEFSFLQLAGVLTIQQLVVVGYWLCASYRLREDGLCIPAEPISSVDEIKDYLDGAKGCYGVNKARRALRWVADGARSPMEAKLATLAALPQGLGGYDFSVPRINYRIDAESLDSLTLDREDRKYFEIDLYWEKERVGVEYDGADHYEKYRVRKDKRRLNCLVANGERILCVMFDQLTDESVRTALMNQLAKLLGKEQKPLAKEEELMRNELCTMLFENGFAL